MLRTRIIALALLLTAGSSTALAEPLLAQFTFMANGSLNDVGFEDSMMTLRVRYSSESVYSPYPGGPLLADFPRGSATIEGLGDVEIVMGFPDYLVKDSVDDDGLYYLSSGYTIGFQSPSLVGYDLRGPIGPVVGIGGTEGWPVEFQTNRGTLSFSSWPLRTVFSVSVVPEPSSLLALGSGVGLVGLASAAARRRARSDSSRDG